MAEANTVTDAVAGIAAQASSRDPLRRPAGRFDPFDIATVVLIAALVVIALWTFRDYAISNDEAVQHHYGELIIAYYTSGFKDQSVFNFENLYLYGGLFDIIAVALGHLVPIDPYDLRHILCALIGIGGIGAAAATARLIAGPRAALIAAIGAERLRRVVRHHVQPHQGHSLCRRDDGGDAVPDPDRAALPSPRAGDIAAFGLLAGAALGMRVLGLLLVIYAGLAIALYLPSAVARHGRRNGVS